MTYNAPPTPLTVSKPRQVTFPSNQRLLIRYAYDSSEHVVYELRFVPEEKRTRQQPYKYGIRALYAKSPMPTMTVAGHWSWFNNRAYLWDMQGVARRKLITRAREIAAKGGQHRDELLRLIKRT